MIFFMSITLPTLMLLRNTHWRNLSNILFSLNPKMNADFKKTERLLLVLSLSSHTNCCDDIVDHSMEDTGFGYMILAWPFELRFGLLS